MAAESRLSVTVGDRTMSLSNLDKVMYPEVGFTKAQVIDYYARSPRPCCLMSRTVA